MTTPTPQEPKNQLTRTLQSMVDTESSMLGIFSKTAAELFKIQSSAWACGLDENLSALSPSPMPQNPAHLLWQVPKLMQQKASRRVGNWQDALAVLSDCQQQMLAWACQSMMGNVSQASSALSKINGVYFSRRQSSQVINFPDRRMDSEAEQSSLNGGSQNSQRLALHVAA